MGTYFVDLCERVNSRWIIHVVFDPGDHHVIINGERHDLATLTTEKIGPYRSLGGAGGRHSALLVLPPHTKTVRFADSDVGRLELRGAARMSSRRFAYKSIGRHLAVKTDAHTLSFSSGPLSILRAAFRWNAAIGASILTRALPPRVVVYRTLAPLARLLHRQTWVISDSPNKAGDNGEALFRFLHLHPADGVTPIFAIADPHQRKILGAYGKTVDPTSFRGKLAYLGAPVIVSSQAGPYVTDALGDHGVYRGLVRSRFVFLQHGVLFHDLSAVIGRYLKRICLIVASGAGEAQALTKDYGFLPDQVALTGMPRMDRLADHRQRTILIAPTWRSCLAHVSSEEFRGSQYFRFWDAVLNDEGLLAALRDAGYHVEFLLHPSLTTFVGEFHGSDLVQISTPPHDYTGAFGRCALLVTDYSSVAYDVAYLDKPVIYAQFDYADFYDGQTYERGDDDTRTRGFGPVTSSLDGLRSAILGIISDAEGEFPSLDSQYRVRRDEAFTFRDQNNSSRVVQAIQQMLKSEELEN